MKTLLVDISALFWAAWHAGADKDMSFAFESTVDRVARWASHYQCVGVCIDAPPYKRKDICANYKAQRDAPEPAAVAQLSRVIDRLDADGHHLFRAKGYEADDVIASLVAQWRLNGGYDVESVDILSGDKDLLQLVTDRVCVVNPRDGKRYDTDAVIEKFGVHPEQMRDLLALMGDRSDNVPGIPNVGAKKAAKMLLEHGDIAGVVRASETFTPALRAAFDEHAVVLETSTALVTLMTDAPVQWEDFSVTKERKPIVQDADFDDIPEEEGDSDPEASIGEPVPRPKSEPYQDAPPPQPKSEPRATQAIVRAEPESWALSLEPRSMRGAMWLAKALYESRLYPQFKNPEGIMAIILRGRELGMGAMTALAMFHLYEGRPMMQAHLIIGLAKKHPSCEYFQLAETNAKRATYETKRRGEPEPTRLTYTIEEAQQSGVVRGRGNWDTRPAAMLRKQCGVELARAVYPDVVGGLYDPDEFESAA